MVLRKVNKSKDNLVHILGNLITNLAPGLYQGKKVLVKHKVVCES